MIYIFIYVGIIVLAILKIAVSKVTILLKMSTLLIFNFIFVLIALLWSFTAQSTLSISSSSFLAIILLLPFLIKNKWFLFRHSAVRTNEIIERCLSMVLIPFVKIKGGYVLTLSEGDSGITTYGLLPGLAIINFNEMWKQKKVEVLQALLKKNFGSMFPKIVIHLKK